jgi:hypothetical protein
MKVDSQTRNVERAFTMDTSPFVIAPGYTGKKETPQKWVIAYTQLVCFHYRWNCPHPVLPHRLKPFVILKIASPRGCSEELNLGQRPTILDAKKWYCTAQ